MIVCKGTSCSDSRKNITILFLSWKCTEVTQYFLPKWSLSPNSVFEKGYEGQPVKLNVATAVTVIPDGDDDGDEDDDDDDGDVLI